MAKKAFCVGINDYPYHGYDLKGCVNDVLAWSELLVDHYDFPQSDIKIITNAEATKENILNGVKELLTGAQAGDVLVFCNASHGSYVLDTSKDEEKYDEVICPYHAKEEEVKDDDLRQLFANLPTDVKLTVITDSCFSGTATRYVPGEFRRARFFNPELRGYKSIANLINFTRKKAIKYPESGMNEILLSACTDLQFAYDDKFGTKYHGAMTFYALQTIHEANYKITYAELIKKINQKLQKAHFPQQPQLEGKQENKERQIFV